MAAPQTARLPRHAGLRYCAVMNVLIFIQWPVDAWSIPTTKVTQLRERFPALTIVHTTDREATLQRIPDAAVCFTPFLTSAMVDAAHRLRWVHSPAPQSRDCFRCKSSRPEESP